MRTARKEQVRPPKKGREPESSKMLAIAQVEVQEVPAGKADEIPPHESVPEIPDNKLHGMKATKVSIRMEQGSVVKGKINLRSELAIRDGSYDCYSLDSGAFYTKVSDLFSKGLNPFIEVFDVEDCNDGTVLIINKSKIIWVSTDEK